MAKKYKIAIVGGGIAGLSLANFLERQSHEISVFEKSKADRTSGGGLLLSANSLACFMTTPLYTDLIAKGALVDGIDVKVMNSDSLLSSTEMQFSVQGVICKSIAISRNDLHTVLKSQLKQTTIHYDTIITTITESGNGVNVQWGEKNSSQFDILIGCDGIASQVHDTINGVQARRDSQQTCWRGITSTRKFGEKFVPNRLTEYWGQGRKFGCVRLNDEQIYWFAVRKRIPDDPRLDIGQLVDDFGAHNPFIESLMQTTPQTAVSCLPLEDREPQTTTRWFSRRIVLCGDAIHATTPNMGQGAGMAIESSFQLAKLLGASRSVEEIFRAYAASRKPRTDYVTKTSRKIGQLTVNENRMVNLARNAIAFLTPNTLLQKQQNRFVSQSPAMRSLRAG